MPFLNLTTKQEIAIKNGQKICLDELNIDDQKINYFLSKSIDDFMICKCENRIICFFKIEKNFVKPTRVFNL